MGGGGTSSAMIQNSSISTFPLVPLLAHVNRQSSSGRGFPVFVAEDFNEPPSPHHNTTAITITRENNFVNPPPPHLEGSDFTTKEVHKLVQTLHTLLRSSAYDETVLERLIDDEAICMLSLVFLP